MTLTPGLSLSPREKQLIRDSFESLREYSASVVLLFYGRLFELEPRVRPLFKPDLHDQAEKLLATLTMVVEALDHFEEVRTAFLILGARHASLNVQPEHYEVMIKSLLWTLGQALGIEFDHATRTGWERLLRVVSAVMLEGAAGAPAFVE